MSRLSDYSKFDHFVDSDDEADVVRNGTEASSQQQQQHAHQQSMPIHQAVPQQPKKINCTKKGSEKGRYIFEYQGRKIYEWEQSLEGAWQS